jgi:hypothetical protein
VTGGRAAEIVERPVAGRLCGEDRVLYAHVLPPELPFVVVRAFGTRRTSAIRHNAVESATAARHRYVELGLRGEILPVTEQTRKSAKGSREASRGD